MAVPSSRQQLKDYCLRRLGSPVVDINVDDEQVDDRIDDALEYYQDYHFDGTERIFLKHQLTADEITSDEIIVPDAVIGVVNIFDIGDAVQSSNLFNIRYQIHLNDLFDFTSTTYVPYVNAMRHIEMLEEIFVGKKPIRFSRHTNKLRVDSLFEQNPGEFLIIECYRILDPDTFTEVYGDIWLRRYATALIKRQWGENLKKFEGMQLPGGITFNGQKIWEEATEEINKLEEEMISSYSLPVADFMG
ncbi:MAG: hypothetical protein CBD09_00745 [Puniceicoccaceae bacterium TMED149]|nr:MAG: hypothetical protein CBD09_00745 [Puniceicoccaceae bacterium TMED149]